MRCALCKEKECYLGKDCTKGTEALKIKEMCTGRSHFIMKTAAQIEAEYYMEKNRLEELLLFAGAMGYRRLGIAFCIGLEKEARVIHEILAEEFDVHSVCCKICGLNKDDYALEKLRDDDFEPACNPLGQALILNKEETDLNIILGLCIGHDILFTEHSKAPVTTLAVKDRVLAHNPLGAIYSKYYIDQKIKIGDKGSK